LYCGSTGYNYLRAVVNPGSTIGFSPSSATLYAALSGTSYGSYIDWMPDADGVNFDYLFQVDPTTTSLSYQTTTTFSGYSINDGTNTLWAADVNSTVPVPLSTCIMPTAAPTTSYPAVTITLKFDKLFNDMFPSAMYIWPYNINPIANPPAFYLYPTPDGNDFDYGTTTFPENAMSYTGYVSSSCYTLYWSPFVVGLDPSNAVTSDPEYFGTKVNLCPCCASNAFTYTITTTLPTTVNFVSTLPANWDFGDSHTASNVDNVSHDYTLGGTVSPCCSRTVTSDASFGVYGGVNPIFVNCSRSREVCMPTIARTSFTSPSGITPDPCTGNDDFTVEFDPNGAVILTGNIPNTTWGATIYWGDGHTDPFNPTGANPHLYSSLGSYDITLENSFPLPNSFFYPSGAYAQCRTQMLGICAVARPASTTEVKTSLEDIKLAPNPASDVSYLSFSCANEDRMKIYIVDATGRVVMNLIDQQMSMGYHTVEIPTTKFATGIYNVSIQNSKTVATEKLSVIK